MSYRISSERHKSSMMNRKERLIAAGNRFTNRPAPGSINYVSLEGEFDTPHAEIVEDSHTKGIKNNFTMLINSKVIEECS